MLNRWRKFKKIGGWFQKIWDVKGLEKVICQYRVVCAPWLWVNNMTWFGQQGISRHESSKGLKEFMHVSTCLLALLSLSWEHARTSLKMREKWSRARLLWRPQQKTNSNNIVSRSQAYEKAQHIIAKLHIWSTADPDVWAINVYCYVTEVLRLCFYNLLWR